MLATQHPTTTTGNIINKDPIQEDRFELESALFQRQPILFECVERVTLLLEQTRIAFRSIYIVSLPKHVDDDHSSSSLEPAIPTTYSQSLPHVPSKLERRYAQLTNAAHNTCHVITEVSELYSLTSINDPFPGWHLNKITSHNNSSSSTRFFIPHLPTNGQMA